MDTRNMQAQMDDNPHTRKSRQGTHLLCRVTATLVSQRKWLQYVQKKVKVPCQERSTMEGSPKLDVEERRNLGEVPCLK